MTEIVTKTDLADYGAPDLVYVRAVSGRELAEDPRVEASGPIDPEGIWYSVHAADGERLAVLDDRDSAYAAARLHELNPVAVH